MNDSLLDFTSTARDIQLQPMVTTGKYPSHLARLRNRFPSTEILVPCWPEDSSVLVAPRNGDDDDDGNRGGRDHHRHQIRSQSSIQGSPREPPVVIGCEPRTTCPVLPLSWSVFCTGRD